MDYIQAKNKIMALWKEGGMTYEKVRQKEYTQMYYAVLPYLKDRNQEWQRAVGNFMMYGAMSYDRFAGQRPKVAEEEQYEMFCRFLNTLQKKDGGYMGRTAFFHLHKIQWDIYRECSLMPYDDEQEAFLAQCENMVKEIEIPQEDANVARHLEQLKGDVLGLIESIRGGEIRTSIRTKLPYKMTNTDAEIHLVVDGIEVEVKAKHQSQGSTIPIAKVVEGSTMTTTGPSKCKPSVNPVFPD